MARLFCFCGNQLRIVSTASTIMVIVASNFVQPAQAARLTNWQLDSATFELEVTLDEATTPHYFLLSQPPRIVLDLPNTQLGTVQTQQAYSGAIRQIRVSQFQAGITRIVLDLSPEVILEPQQIQLQSLGNRVVLRPFVTRVTTSADPQAATTLPPATFPGNQLGRVQVPPLNPSTTPASTVVPVTNLPPAIFPSNSSVSVRVPPLQSAPAVTPAPISPPVRTSRLPTPSTVIEFGQPLPKAANTEALDSVIPSLAANTRTPTKTAVLPSLDSSSVQNRASRTFSYSSSPDALLPAGTQLRLRYSGSEIITLKGEASRQETLLLEEEIRDRNGKIIAPVGTPVSGRFETDRNGSRFIAQTIILSGQNIPLSAESDSLDGSRVVSDKHMVRNSAFGALAGVLLGGFSGIGLLGGAAAAAATTYLSAPQPITVQPNQIVQVQLMADLL